MFNGKHGYTKGQIMWVIPYLSCVPFCLEIPPSALLARQSRVKTNHFRTPVKRAVNTWQLINFQLSPD